LNLRTQFTDEIADVAHAKRADISGVELLNGFDVANHSTTLTRPRNDDFVIVEVLVGIKASRTHGGSGAWCRSRRGWLRLRQNWGGQSKRRSGDEQSQHPVITRSHEGPHFVKSDSILGNRYGTEAFATLTAPSRRYSCVADFKIETFRDTLLQTLLTVTEMLYRFPIRTN
jgi:hypothetical protein